MRKFDLLYESVVAEAMNRRDFLRTLGKGASIAGAKPAAVGKMLMNVAGSSAKKSVLKGVLSNYFYENSLHWGGYDLGYRDIKELKEEIFSAENSLNFKQILDAFKADNLSLIHI